ncbi:MAG: hypothetical protein H0T76_27360 [Nannocystis sp.]|nr:hypothetical protein [Nannocystis sp.]MBA3550210.1 hypothetical protein [Nannocystis sp.]
MPHGRALRCDTTNFGNGALVSAGKADVFLARLDPKGTTVWSQRFGDAEGQQIRDMTIGRRPRRAGP